MALISAAAMIFISGCASSNATALLIFFLVFLRSPPHLDDHYIYDARCWLSYVSFYLLIERVPRLSVWDSVGSDCDGVLEQIPKLRHKLQRACACARMF